MRAEQRARNRAPSPRARLQAWSSGLLCSAGVLLLGAVGCEDGGASGAETVACDPLVMAERPIALERVVAVGKAQDGTLYVLDDPADADLRVFVSDGDVLQRERVLGSGSGSDSAGMFYQVGIDVDPELTLFVQIDDGGDTTLTLGATDADSKGNPPADGEVLATLSEDDLKDLSVRNLAPEVVIEYLAELDDGTQVLVTRPRDDWDYEDFRLFIGPKDDVVEREVMDVSRARDGGSTFIDFTLDGEAATLHFPIEFVDDQFTPGQATLEVAGEVSDLTLLDPDPDAVAKLMVSCLD